jgi:hypothetical protein
MGAGRKNVGPIGPAPVGDDNPMISDPQATRTTTDLHLPACHDKINADKPVGFDDQDLPAELSEELLPLLSPSRAPSPASCEPSPSDSLTDTTLTR